MDPFKEWWLSEPRCSWEEEIARAAWNAAVKAAAQVCDGTGGMESGYHAANVRSLQSPHTEGGENG